MSSTALILMFIIIANLPWLTERSFLVGPRQTHKPVVLRLLEWLILYFISLGIALVLEYRFSGEPYPQAWQAWEFYVITFCLFLVLAVPGVIYRYQWLPIKHKKNR